MLNPIWKEGWDDREVNQYFDENPKIISLLEIDIFDINTPYISHGEKDVDSSDTEEPLDDKTLRELRLQQEAMEREMQVFQHVQASTLEELNLTDNDTKQRTMLIAWKRWSQLRRQSSLNYYINSKMCLHGPSRIWRD